MRECRYKRKSELFNEISKMDFKNHFREAETLLNDCINNCHKQCGIKKCDSYYNFIRDVAEKYKESRK